jgi:hypothetical protein
MGKYSQLVDKASLPHRKIKLLKFKKEAKVVKIFPKKQLSLRKTSHVLDLQKDDYGIYSISANRTFYYKP